MEKVDKRTRAYKSKAKKQVIEGNAKFVLPKIECVFTEGDLNEKLKNEIDGRQEPQTIEGLKVTKAEGGGDVVECKSVHAAGWVDPDTPLDWSKRTYTSGQM
jgi:hypothetical protein